MSHIFKHRFLSIAVVLFALAAGTGIASASVLLPLDEATATLIAG